MKLFFIVNPVAGNGKAKKYWEIYCEKIFREFGKQNFKFTEYNGHAIEIAEKVRDDDYDAIISSGGDGTLNEVVNGAAGSKSRIGLLPLGTGSDFGKTLGIRSFDDFRNSLKSGKTLKVDLALVEFPNVKKKRYFINILEIGFGANVMDYVNRHKIFGKYSFLLGVFATLSRMKKFDLEINLNSEHLKFSTIEGIIANGKYFGGGMLASPESRVNDGILDIHVLKPFSKFRSALQLRDLINGEYIKKGYANNFSASEVSVTSEGQLVEMDGEVVGKTPLNVTLEKGVVEFLVP